MMNDKVVLTLAFVAVFLCGIEAGSQKTAHAQSSSDIRFSVCGDNFDFLVTGECVAKGESGNPPRLMHRNGSVPCIPETGCGPSEWWVCDKGFVPAGAVITWQGGLADIKPQRCAKEQHN
jgi:hypothetical protein